MGVRVSFPGKFCFFGLDNAGKTTIAYKMRLGEVETVVPPGCIGFTIEQCCNHETKLTLVDVGASERVNPKHYSHYMEESKHLVFVVDSSDRDRVDGDFSACSELHRLANMPEAQDASWVIFANKQDLPAAMSVDELKTKLRLSELPSTCRWAIAPCCATTGDGLFEGLEPLSNHYVKLEKERKRKAREDQEAVVDENKK